MAKFEVTAPDGRVVVLEGDAPPTDQDLDGIFAELPAQTEQVSQVAQTQPSESPEDRMTRINIGARDALLSGLMKGGAGLLDAEQNLTNLVYKAASQGPIKLAKPSQVFGDAAKKAREFADTQIPERKGVLNKVIEGAGEVPGMVAQVEMLGGGTKGLALMGGLEGSSRGALDSVIGASVNAMLGQFLKGVSMIKPGAMSASKITPAITGATRATLGGTAFAAPEVLHGSEDDEVAAKAILGASMAIPTGNGKNLSEAIKRKLLNTAKPELRVRALESLKKLRATQEADLAKKKVELSKQQRQETAEVIKPIREESGVVRDEASAKKANVENMKNAEAQKKQLEEQKIKQEFSDQEVMLQMEKEAMIEAEKIQLTNDLNNLAQKVDFTIKSRASELQPEMMKMFSEKSKQYEPKLEAVADKIDQNTPITIGEVYAFLRDAKAQSINEADINFGKPLEAINRLMEKYNPGTDPNNPAFDAKGQRVIRQDNEPVSFKDVRKDLKKIEKLIGYGGRPSPEDIPGYIVKSKFGEFVASKDTTGDFASLQTAYSEVIGAMNRASKSFAVYKDKFANDTAESTLRAIKEGRTSGALDRTLEFLKSGTKEFPGGIGDRFSDIRELGRQESILEQLSSNRKAKIGKDASTKLEALEKAKAERLEKTQTNYDRRLDEFMKRTTQIEREMNDKQVELKNKTQAERERVAKDYEKKLEDLEREFNDSVVGEGKFNLDKRIERATKVRGVIKRAKRFVATLTAASLFGIAGAKRIAASRIASEIQRDVT